MTTGQHQQDDTPSTTILPPVETAAVMAKKWQYADMLQLCIRGNCHGQRGAAFYNCAYANCVVPKHAQQQSNQRQLYL